MDADANLFFALGLQPAFVAVLRRAFSTMRVIEGDVTQAWRNPLPAQIWAYSARSEPVSRGGTK